MNIATLVQVTPTGKPPYESEHGPLYSFNVVFDDNRTGLVNSKSEVPPYKAGDRVGYEVTGKLGKTDKLKITRNPDKPFTQTPQMAPPTQPVYQAPVHKTEPPIQTHARAEHITTVFGATCGMAINQALDLLTRDLSHDDRIERIISPVFWKSVHEVASDVIRVSRHLEAGNLAPSPSERANQAQGLKKAPSVAPRTVDESDFDAQENMNPSVPF